MHNIYRQGGEAIISDEGMLRVTARLTMIQTSTAIYESLYQEDTSLSRTRINAELGDRTHLSQHLNTALEEQLGVVTKKPW